MEQKQQITNTPFAQSLKQKREIYSLVILNTVGKMENVYFAEQVRKYMIEMRVWRVMLMSLSTQKNRRSYLA